MDEHWIECSDDKFGSLPNVEDGQTYCGKWLIFGSETHINDIWNNIKNLTVNGYLGIGAKVSTKLHVNYMNSNTYVICVYTKDYRLKDDVKRVLLELRKLGISQILYYKTDATTLQGVYSSNTPNTTKVGKASTYCSDDFEMIGVQKSMMDY